MNSLIMRALTSVALLAAATAAQAGQWHYNMPVSAPAEAVTNSKPAMEKSTSTGDMMLPPPAEHATGVKMPRSGIKLDKVRNDFGSPQVEIPAVGKPPILRWKYPEYIVYFEYDLVIISVPIDI